MNVAAQIQPAHGTVEGAFLGEERLYEVDVDQVRQVVREASQAELGLLRGVPAAEVAQEVAVHLDIVFEP